MLRSGGPWWRPLPYDAEHEDGYVQLYGTRHPLPSTLARRMGYLRAGLGDNLVDGGDGQDRRPPTWSDGGAQQPGVAASLLDDDQTRSGAMGAGVAEQDAPPAIHVWWSEIAESVVPRCSGGMLQRP
ncbi:hypothetical protein U9M48_001717, partial [Paspalum notatum var. saurae]